MSARRDELGSAEMKWAARVAAAMSWSGEGGRALNCNLLSRDRDLVREGPITSANVRPA